MIFGGVLVALFSYLAYASSTLSPAANASANIALGQSLEPAFFATFACFGAAMMLGQRGAQCWMWAIRGTIFFLLLAPWRITAMMKVTHWVEWAGLLIALLIGHHVARRQTLGWIVDERGERQKVDHWNRGHAIYTPKTRGQRLVEEATLRNERRLKLLWSTPVTAFLVWGMWRLHVAGNDFLMFAPGFILVAVGGFEWGPAAVNEVLYLFGYQDMDGHQVLDEPARRRGVDDVTTQKAHGDATLASAEEADRLLKKRR